jgi:hypothetical protein
MEIDVRVIRDIIVDDVTYRRDINPSSGDISCN